MKNYLFTSRKHARISLDKKKRANYYRLPVVRRKYENIGRGEILYTKCRHTALGDQLYIIVYPSGTDS